MPVMCEQETILQTQLEVRREQRMMLHRDLNEKKTTKQVTKVIYKGILGENTNSKTREQVGENKDPQENNQIEKRNWK